MTPAGDRSGPRPATVPGFTAAGLVMPDYDGLSLGAVLPAVADVLGVPLTIAGRSGAGARARFGLPRTDRVCVVMVDGAGHEPLSERSGHAPFLRSLLESGQVLTAGFPTTTATSMALFGTGCAAGRTGLTGYTVRDPASGALVNLVSWDGPLSPRELQTAPTVFELLTEAGVSVTSVGPAKFAGSGLTEAALRGAAYVAAETLERRVDAALEALAEPGLVHLYWGQVDKVGHHHGWGSWQWAAELTALDRELDRLAAGLPAGALLLVTADHGMIDVDPTQRWDVAVTRELLIGVRLVAGEPRASHVYCEPGQAPSVARRWRETLEDAVVVVDRQEAIAAGWFGPVEPRHEPLIGDLVVAATGRAAVVDTRTQTVESTRLVGLHGSFTPAEMHVPLLVAY